MNGLYLEEDLVKKFWLSDIIMLFCLCSYTQAHCLTRDSHKPRRDKNSHST